jgi:membrane-bound ClpP family serine protease
MAFALEPLLFAVALLVVAAALLVLEFFLVSFGILLVMALAAVGGSIYFAFQSADWVGWVFLCIVPVIAFFITRWGIARVQRSKLIPKREITAEAGYHHLADRFGIGLGSVGEMVTPAMPSGRARFGGGEVDVRAMSGSLERGRPVRVERIEGPAIYVVAVDTGT